MASRRATFWVQMGMILVSKQYDSEKKKKKKQKQKQKQTFFLFSTFLPQGDCTNSFGGTSSAAPLAAGVVALMLGVNPSLGWKDVQYILISSASKVDPTDADWVQNGAGRFVNHKYGYGLLNARFSSFFLEQKKRNSSFFFSALLFAWLQAIEITWVSKSSVFIRRKKVSMWPFLNFQEPL